MCIYVKTFLSKFIPIRFETTGPYALWRDRPNKKKNKNKKISSWSKNNNLGNVTNLVCDKWIETFESCKSVKNWIVLFSFIITKKIEKANVYLLWEDTADGDDDVTVSLHSVCLGKYYFYHIIYCFYTVLLYIFDNCGLHQLCISSCSHLQDCSDLLTWIHVLA